MLDDNFDDNEKLLEKDKLFLKMETKSETKKSLNFCRTITARKRTLKNNLYKTIGKGKYVRKPSPLLRLEEGMKKLFFSKNCLLFDYVPQLRQEFSQKERKLQFSLEDKIDLGNIAFLNSKDYCTSPDINKRKEIQRKLLLRSSNYKQMKPHLAKIEDQFSLNTSRVSKKKKRLYLTQTNSPVKKPPSLNSSKIFKTKPSKTIFVNNQSTKNSGRYSLKSSYTLNNSTYAPLNLTESVNDASEIARIQNIKSTRVSKKRMIKLTLLPYKQIDGNFFSPKKSSPGKSTPRKSLNENSQLSINSGCAKHKMAKQVLYSANNSKKISKKLNFNKIIKKLNDVKGDYSKAEKDIIDIIDNNEIDDGFPKRKKKKINVKQDIQTIFNTTALANKSTKTILQQALSNRDNENFINSALNKTVQMTDKQAMNYVDKMMFGSIKKIDFLSKDNEPNIFERVRKEREVINTMKKKLKKNNFKILKLENNITQKAIKLNEKLHLYSEEG